MNGPPERERPGSGDCAGQKEIVGTLSPASVRLADRLAVRRRRGRTYTAATGLRGRWGFLVDLGYAQVVLLRLDWPLAVDLFRRLGWLPSWSEAGQGWLVPRSYIGKVERTARQLSVELHTVQDHRLGLAGVS